ncbi:hypothetical protein RN001_004750 [Aquatica leii]|uniref:AB hydrolase-1 domain-containing protein n=1 Tax=Aquatica leii TaxID=1421715 RepID=A0AAN7SA85_9COLE|nr:hypothetical protein RN001_004750 [Aquatica leii]
MTNKPTKYSGNIAQEHQIVIDDQTINYIKHGKGNEFVLCFPGALGSIWSDFRPQIEGLDTNKFTIVAWDPPGYGHSRPPSRTVPKNFYERDADLAFKFMEGLNIKKYSLLGWSDGGVSSMILAAKHPNRVTHLVIWGSNAYVVEEDVTACEQIRDINTWSEKMKSPLIKMYGEEEFQRLWNEWIDTLNLILKDGGNICKHFLPGIKCPTLILHGNKDRLLAKEHPYNLLENIKNSKIHVFPNGKHNIHLRYAEDFNAIVTRFIADNHYKNK